MRLSRNSLPWAELVFHVLAHVRESAHLPASVFDPSYVSDVAEQLGPASGRTLDEDARALGVLARTHEALARVQLVAWLFSDAEHAGRFATTDLTELGAGDVLAPEVLPALSTVTRAAELLRCAALLEQPLLVRLDAIEVDWPRIEAELSAAVTTAPLLASSEVSLVRSLRLRGRVRGNQIWVGAPERGRGPSVEHVVWQASHEATVRELALAHTGPERAIEHAALVLMAERARAARRDASHARWLAGFGDNLPRVDRSALAPELGALVAQLAETRSGT